VLSPTGKSKTIKAILKADGFVVTFKALEAGKLTIACYQVPPGAHIPAIKKKAPKPVVVADGTARISKAGKLTVKIKLTTTGKKLLNKSRELKLTAEASFLSTGKKPNTTRRSETFTLH
jgi:hypothetical protein